LQVHDDFQPKTRVHNQCSALIKIVFAKSFAAATPIIFKSCLQCQVSLTLCALKAMPTPF